MKNLLISGLLIYVGIGLYLYLKQHSFIYFPTYPTKSNLDQRIFRNDGHSIKALVLNKGNKKAIVYFGGNAENVGYNADQFSDIFPEHTVYLVNYRGYGESTGTPSEKAIYSDAIHIYKVLTNDHSKISVIGRSLGSAVATYVASKNDIHKLVLITPFDSIQNIAQSTFPIYPMSILLKEKHDSFARAKDIKAKTLIIAAEQDRVIKMPHTKRLVEGFTSEVIFHVIRDVGHNNISSHPRYYSLLGEFL